MLRLNSRRIIATVAIVAVAFSMIAGYGICCRNNYSFADANPNDYYISDYHVDVTVTEDRVYRITEKISCVFGVEKHGIYRSIPTAFRVKRADGSSSRMTARVRHFESDAIWEEDSDYDPSGTANSYYTVRLGDPYVTVEGKQDYTISYDYVCSPDTLKESDEFYFNIIGSGWDTDIEHVTFNVRMPKKYDNSAVGFSMGYSGIVGVPAGELISNVEGLNISGETLRTLNPGEALTIRTELPEGYFVTEQGIGQLWVYIATVILALVAAALCFKLGRDDKIIPSIQFSPPEGYNSLDVGVMDHLDATDNDVLSLLVYLADKGYLTIEPLEKKLLGKQKFRFHKQREYDGNNPCERDFLDGMFGGSSSVDSTDLEDYFYQTVQSIVLMERGFTSELVWRKGRIPITFMILAGLLLMYLPSYIYGGFGNYLFSLTGINLIGFAAGVVAIIIMIISWGMIQRRTELGVELAGQARGFKEFIETAEKDRIEQLIEEDPQSFYSIIPYAMALGVTDAWIEKFKGITLPRPGWYLYDDPYIDGYILGSMLGSTLQDTMQSVSSAPESSGGGGFSGGGAGGGGGGSW